MGPETHHLPVVLSSASCRPNLSSHLSYRQWMAFLEYLGVKDFIYGPNSLPLGARFDYQTNSPYPDIFKIHDGGRRVTSLQKGTKTVLAEPALRHTTLWRIKIHCLSRKNPVVMVGIDWKPNRQDSPDSPSTFGWTSGGQICKPDWISHGRHWEGFQQGDELVMKLVMEQVSALLMHVPRLNKTLRMDLPPQPFWYIFITCYEDWDSVELLPALSSDASLFG